MASVTVEVVYLVPMMLEVQQKDIQIKKIPNAAAIFG